MPTLSAMDIKFKKVQQDMQGMMTQIGKLHVKRKEFDSEMASADSRNFTTFLSKADFKKNWTAVQKKLEKFEEKNREMIRVVTDNTDFIDKIR